MNRPRNTHGHHEIQPAKHSPSVWVPYQGKQLRVVSSCVKRVSAYERNAERILQMAVCEVFDEELLVLCSTGQRVPESKYGERVRT